MISASNEHKGQQQSNPDKSNEIWNRVGHVEITIFKGTGSKTFNFDGLDFKFSISTILGRVPEGNMSVSICGLSQDTANHIVTLCNIMQALSERKTLKLYAGYADPENEKYKGELLATMDIVNATITTPPPDIWLQITAVYAAWLNDKPFAIDIMDISEEKKTESISVVGSSTTGYTQSSTSTRTTRTARYLPLKKVGEQIVKILNEFSTFHGREVKYTFDMTSIEKRYNKKHAKMSSSVPGKTRRFAFSGTLEQIPTKVSEYYKVLAMWEYRDDNTICLAIYPDPKYARGLMDKEKIFVEGALIKFLDVDHGLIGIPKLKDSIKLECRCFLDGKIKPGDYVSVRSEMLPVIYDMGQNMKPSNKALSEQWGSASWRKDKDTGETVAEDKDTIKAYQIMKIKYQGHLRGNEWYCDIEARRPDIIQNRIEEVTPETIRLTEDYSKIMEGWVLNEKTGELTKKMLTK